MLHETPRCALTARLPTRLRTSSARLAGRRCQQTYRAPVQMRPWAYFGRPLLPVLRYAADLRIIKPITSPFELPASLVSVHWPFQSLLESPKPPPGPPVSLFPAPLPGEQSLRSSRQKLLAPELAAFIGIAHQVARHRRKAFGIWKLVSVHVTDGANDALG